MIVLLLNIIFCCLSALSEIVALIICNVIARLLVLLVQAFRVPSQAMQGALEQVRSLIGVCLDYCVELVLEVFMSLISAFFDNLKERISATSTGSPISNVLVQVFPEVLEGLISGTITSML